MTHEDEFEAYLRRRSILPPRTTESLEPPAALDDIVLSRARRAIQQPPDIVRYRAPRWAFPVALAATLLLCVAVVVNVGMHTQRQRAPAVAPAAPSADAAYARALARPPDPQSWLQRIETLRAQGKTQQAEAEWRRFRAAFPDYPVSPPQAHPAAPAVPPAPK